MRTTLDLDDDVLQSAKEIAAAGRSTAGRVISELVRKALKPPGPIPAVRNGVPLLTRRAPGRELVTTKAVNDLLDDE
jgi:hypothetical protein